MASYRLKSTRVLRGKTVAVAGEVVYDCSSHDYGMAGDDTRMLGYPHQSVTKDPDGGYPFFTVPTRDLERLP